MKKVEMMHNAIDNVKKIVQSRETTNLDDLNSEYQRKFHRPIQFTSWGFNDLESFLNVVPGLKFEKATGLFTVETKKGNQSSSILKIKRSKDPPNWPTFTIKQSLAPIEVKVGKPPPPASRIEKYRSRSQKNLAISSLPKSTMDRKCFRDIDPNFNFIKKTLATKRNSDEPAVTESKSTSDERIQSNETKETVDNLLKILENYPSGVCMSELAATYKVMCGVLLPSNLKNILIKKQDLFVIEKVENKMIIKNNPQASKKMREPKVPVSQIAGINITVVVNSTEIWGIIEDPEQNVQIEQMFNELPTDRMKPATEILQKNYYALKDGDTFHRIRVNSLNLESKVAKIFFIDIGKTDIVSWDNLFELDSSLYDVPPQATCFSLEGLENYKDNEAATWLIAETLGNKYYYINDFRKHPDEWVFNVCFYEYSNKLKKEINLNERMKTKILKSIQGSKSLDLENEMIKVQLKSSDISIQMKDKKYLNALMRLLRNFKIDNYTEEVNITY